MRACKFYEGKLMKDTRIAYKPHQGLAVDDNMSNLTSASICSSNNSINVYPHQNLPSFASPPSDIINQAQSVPRKRRNLPGNPDPEAEVVALSPRSLMATNRFVCEICNKGFQRDQNLQLHRRGHNLPWKLKQRNKQEVVRKKVYVCPEPSCVHHDPSRALGDLTGIKKHFSRKHGEKKWKCDKCSKRYAVQSDWKAHSKICGTREYRCDCGTLFSRRDSFITHRAFCDALSQESSRSMTLQTPLFMSSQTAPTTNPSHLIHGFNNFQHPTLINLPPWLSSDHQPGAGTPGPPINTLFTSQRVQQSIHPDPNPNNNNNNNNKEYYNNNNNNNNNNISIPTTFSSSSSSSSPSSLMSATALLQKAAQMGVTMSTTTKITPYQSSPSDQNQSSSITRPHHHHHHHHHVGAPGFFASITPTSNTAGSLMPTREGNIMGTGNFVHGLAPFANRVGASVTGGCMQLHDVGMVSSSLPSTSGAFDGSSAFEDSFNEMLSPNKRSFCSFEENAHLMMSLRKEGGGGGGGGGAGGGGDGLTRDFLGLRAFPDHRDFLSMAGLDDQMGSTSYDHQQDQAQGPWQQS